MKTRFVLLGLIFLCMGSCVAKDPFGFPAITDQGLFALSNENPYLGTNQILAKEMERSSQLLQFIKLQGAPAAIEIKDTGRKYPEMLLYYPEFTRVYTAVLQGGDEKTFRSDWVIRGPYEISRKDYAALRRVLAERIGVVPPLEVYGKVYQFTPITPAQGVAQAQFAQSQLASSGFVPLPVSPLSLAQHRSHQPVRYASSAQIQGLRPLQQVAKNAAGSPLEGTSVLEPEVPFITPTPTPPPPKKKVSKKDKEAQGRDPRVPNFDEMDAKKWKPLNSDQMAIAIAQGYAERNNRGDVIHTVESNRETLFEIASWYTGAGIHESKLQEINDLAANSTLKKGTKIRIPIELLKRVRRLPTTP